MLARNGPFAVAQLSGNVSGAALGQFAIDHAGDGFGHTSNSEGCQGGVGILWIERADVRQALGDSLGDLPAVA